MDVKWDYSLKPGQRANPVVYWQKTVLPADARYPTDKELLRVFTGDGFKLQTWNRTEGVLRNDPHWIAVRGSTPLHVDPKYPRYSHHLKVRCDFVAGGGVSVRGLDKKELQMVRGMYYVLDTHSPHQVLAHKTIWNVAASIDLDEPAADHEEMIRRLTDYACNAPWVDG